MLYFLRIFAAPIFLNTFLHWKILWNHYLFPNQNDDIIWHKASILKRICQENYPRESLGKIWNFTIYSVVIAMLYIMTKLNVILKLELVIVQICPHWQEKGSKEKSAIKDHCFFCQFMRVSLIILPVYESSKFQRLEKQSLLFTKYKLLLNKHNRINYIYFNLFSLSILFTHWVICNY